jgi:glycosyltransferase involved in cell wall biosynthesis
MLNKGRLSIKRHLRNSKPYVVAYEIKEVLKKHLNNNRTKMISLESEKPSRGYVLFSYVIDAFLSEADQPASYSHPAYWESLQMAKTFLQFGYHVDVISAIDAADFTPQRSYEFFVGHRYNFVRIAERLNKDCVKVLHCDLAHPLFHNAANCSRMLALQQRKGITLPLVKFDWPTQAIEHADCATVLGNQFTISTYTYADKPIYRIPISAPFVYSWPERKDFEACRRQFLWFGSDGFVHKGLDLVLDAFAEMPDYHLTVCGPIGQEIEKDFEKAFYKELYQTANIRTLGWLDVGSPEFAKIAADCVGLIYPSCSEGQSGGVVTCMHAGLIPILSYESGVDVDDFGFLLEGSSIENIRDSIRMVASLPAQELKKRARRAWEFARANHTREKFTEQYRKFFVTMARDFGHRLDCVDRSHKSLDDRDLYAASTNVE